jgi:hypothetical protein
VRAQRFVRRVTVACALAALAALIVAAGASAAVFYVDGGVAASGDCLSPAAACKTIADAITKERATPEADTINVAAGTYVESISLSMTADGGLTIAGAGAGSDPSTNTLLESTSGGLTVVAAQAPNTMLKLRGVRVIVAGTATGSAITGGGAALALGRADGPVTVDMANASNNASAIIAGTSVGPTTFDHVTVGGAWTGNAWFGGHNTTVIDSRLATGPTGSGVPALLDGPGAALFQRSVLQVGNPNSSVPVVSSTKLDLTFDSSEVLGGSGVVLSPAEPATHTITIASSTVDAGVLGNRDDPAMFPDVRASSTAGAGSVATVRIDGSILTEPPMATVGSGGTASITCTSTDVASTSQAATASLGAIDCATGSNGNTFTPSLSDLFAGPAPDYTLNPASTAVDSVPESAIALPAGFTASGTDLVGAPRVVNGVGTCAAPIRDKGALELAGHGGVVPAATIASPAGAEAGAPAAFAGSAPNEPSGTPLTFDWQFSDGGTATGQNVSHAFAAAGAASATLTVTAPGGCVGTSTTPLTISAAPAAQPRLDVITAMTISPRAFFARPRGPSVLAAAKRTYGAVVRYKGSQPATTTFTVQRPHAGRRQGGRCRKPTRANRHGRACTYYGRVGSFKHADKAGTIRFRFTGRVRRHALKPGRYRLQAIPRNLAGRGRAVYRKFRIRR